MDTLNIILTASLIASMFSVVCTFYLLWLKRSIREREEQRKTEVLLDFQREKFENQLYDIIDSRPMDNLIVSGNEEIYITNSAERPQLSTKVVDNTFFYSMGIDINKIEVESLSACVVMPFHMKYQKTFDAIKKAAKNSGYVCHRSDEIFVTGDILRNIVRMILSSQVVIAVLDGSNPNVFYEVGIAHSVGKPVIFVVNKNRMETSFDIDHNRMIMYNNYIELEKDLSVFLKKIRSNE